VVAHELVHALHPDHTAEFWARVGRAMPDYERRDRLWVGREYER
jgi:predicted metal-dependent hydrolase